MIKILLNCQNIWKWLNGEEDFGSGVTVLSRLRYVKFPLQEEPSEAESEFARRVDSMNTEQLVQAVIPAMVSTVGRVR